MIDKRMKHLTRHVLLTLLLMAGICSGFAALGFAPADQVHATIYVEGGSPENPNGPGYSGPNSSSNPYVLKYGQSMTLHSDKTAPSAESWYLNSESDQEALVQEGTTSVFKNNNNYLKEPLAVIEHTAGYRGSAVHESFYVRIERPNWQVSFYLKEPGESAFKELGETQQVWGENPHFKVPTVKTSCVVDGQTYLFDGWYADEACTDRIVYYGLNKTTKFYGRYIPSNGKYYIVYDGNASDALCSCPPSEEVTDSGAYTSDYYPSRPGYRKKGWSVDPNTEDPEYLRRPWINIAEHPQTDPDTHILTLYAAWYTYAELVYKNSDESMGTISKDLEVIDEKNPTPKGVTATAKTGYRFVGWKDENGAIISTDSKFVPQKQDGVYRTNTYTACFEPITCRLFFETNGGLHINPQVLKLGEKPGRPQDPINDSCSVFQGWFADSSCTTPFDFDQPLSGDTTIYAKWQDEHDWDEPTYVWAEDDSTVTAKRVCKRDAAHVEEETVKTTPKVTKAPHCEQTGSSDLVAVFMNEAFEKQEKSFTDNIKAYGHNWSEVTYTWSEDNSNVVARRYCRRDPRAHVEAENMPTTATRKEPTCEDKGEITYSATFHKEGLGSCSKIVEIDPLGHEWGEWTVTTPPTKEAEGVESRVCARDPNHVMTRPVPPLGHKHEMTLVSEKKATCETAGHKAYYKCSGCSAWYEDIRGAKQVTGLDILIPAKGHKAGEPVKGEVTEPTCSAVGGYSLTTKCTDCGKVLHVDRVVVPMDPDAHDWGDWVVTMPPTDKEEGSETRTCKHDPSHTESRLIAPSGDSAGIRGLIQSLINMIKDMINSFDKSQIQESYEAYKALPDYARTLLAGYFTDEEIDALQDAWNKYAESLKTVLRSAKAKKGQKVLVKWAENPDVDGYQLYCKAPGVKALKFNINSDSTLKKAVKKLKLGKNYSFKIRPYKEIENLTTGKLLKIYGEWSNVKKAKVK